MFATLLTAVLFFSPLSQGFSPPVPVVERLPALPVSGCIQSSGCLTPGSAPAWAPDGSALVFQRGEKGRRNLFVFDLKSGAERLLFDGPADAVDPVFMGEKQVVFSANTEGTYDLWLVETSGKTPPKRLTDLPGDERLPSSSPIRFRLMHLIPESCGGPYSAPGIEYWKILYQYRYNGQTETRFVSSAGDLKGVVSTDCVGMSYGPDGLSVVGNCGSQVSRLGGEILTVKDALNVWGEGVKAGRYLSLDKMYEKSRNEPDQGSHRGLRHARHRFVRYQNPLFSAPARGVGALSLSLNQLLLLGTSGTGAEEKGGAVAFDMTQSGGTSHSVGLKSGTEPRWSPAGDRLAYTDLVDETQQVCVATTRCPLQTVRELDKHPELTRAGVSGRLAVNGFVARQSEEKEFFHLYEKLRYERKGILVTPDAVLQAFSDVFARTLQKRELEMYFELLKLCEAGAGWALERAKSDSKADTYRHLAILWTVPAVILKAGAPGFKASDTFYFDEEEEEQGKGIEKGYEARLRGQLATVTPLIRNDVEMGLRWLAEEKLREVPAGTIGNASDFIAEFSMAKPRGHYDAPGYRSYFQAMMWLALVPAPVSGDGLACAADLLNAPDTKQAFANLEGLISSMAGPPALPDLALMARLAREQPGLKQADPDEIAQALSAAFGPVRVRGAAAALGKDQVQAYVFPQRLGADVEVIKGLTHPDVPLRGLPSALDVLAAMGNGLAMSLTSPEVGDSWNLQDYWKQHAKLAAYFAAKPDYWDKTVYNFWLKTIQALASDAGIRGPHVPRFATSGAYAYRLLMAGLAGYTQLKHHLVLYSFQNMGVECDTEEVVVLLYEVPMPHQPPVYAEPHPEFYDQLALLCQKVRLMFGVQLLEGDGEEGEGEEDYFSDMRDFVRPDGDALLSLSKTARMLAEISRKELRGQPLSDIEVKFLRYFGGLLESYLLAFDYRDNSNMTGADQGRMSRGVTLVTDIYTNLQREVVLQVGLGLPYLLYAEVPYGPAHGIAIGAMHSWYEFTNKTRLTDARWWERLTKGDLPDRPFWTARFLED